MNIFTTILISQSNVLLKFLKYFVFCFINTVILHSYNASSPLEESSLSTISTTYIGLGLSNIRVRFGLRVG